MDNRTVLQAKVDGVNRAHKYANEIAPKFRDAFAPFVGQKVETKQGPLTAKVKAAVEAVKTENNLTLNVYRHPSNYTIDYTVETCENLNGHAYYYAVTVDVGVLVDGVLTELYEPATFRHDYTAEEIERCREEYQKAKRVMDVARSAIYPFGEYDR